MILKLNKREREKEVNESIVTKTVLNLDKNGVKLHLFLFLRQNVDKKHFYASLFFNPFFSILIYITKSINKEEEKRKSKDDYDYDYDEELKLIKKQENKYLKFLI